MVLPLREIINQENFQEASLLGAFENFKCSKSSRKEDEHCLI